MSCVPRATETKKNAAADGCHSPSSVVGTKAPASNSSMRSNASHQKRSMDTSKARTTHTSSLSRFGILPMNKKNQAASFPKKQARVEPKSYFANERTFIQWISSALLLITVGVLLVEYAPIASKILLGVTVVVILYSVFVYFRRVHLLQTGKPYGYVDHFGPLVLSLSILGGVSVLLYHLVHENASTGAYGTTSTSGGGSSKSFLHEEQGRCFKHSSAGLSPLNFEPSDALVDLDRGLLLVPSKTEIVAFSLPIIGEQGDITAIGDPTNLIDIPGADIEALTIVGNHTVLAVDETVSESDNGVKTNSLYALQWTADDSQLQIVGRWTIPVLEAEGAAFIPGVRRASGQGGLYLAGKSGIQVFELPEITQEGLDPFGEALLTSHSFTTPLVPHHSLNSGELNEGLDSSKIIKFGAMTYFEDVLYILYDNFRMVRAWDLKQGVLLSEWPLPFVAGGWDKQWEGLAIERIDAAPISVDVQRASGLDYNASRHRLRRGNDERHSASIGDLLVHLTLDTPLEVWSFVAREGDTRGSVVFHDCAAAS